MLWPELKAAVLELLKEPSDIEITVRGVPMPENLYIEACIKMVDDHPKKENMSIEEKRFRVEEVLPFYNRLKAYHLLKSNF